MTDYKHIQRGDHKRRNDSDYAPVLWFAFALILAVSLPTILNVAWPW